MSKKKTTKAKVADNQEVDTSSETEELEAALEGSEAAMAEPAADEVAGETDEPVIDDPVPDDDGGGDTGDNAADAGAKDPDPVPEKSLQTFAETRKAADDARNVRITQAMEYAQPHELNEEEAAALELRLEREAKLHKYAEEIEKHENAIEDIKAKSRDVMALLYPQNLKSDRHVDAVRGFLKASADERRNRSTNPARFKDMLERLGKAPIDAAFQRQMARGAARPQHSVAPQGSQSGEQE